MHACIDKLVHTAAAYVLGREEEARDALVPRNHAVHRPCQGRRLKVACAPMWTVGGRARTHAPSPRLHIRMVVDGPVKQLRVPPLAHTAGIAKCKLKQEPGEWVLPHAAARVHEKRAWPGGEGGGATTAAATVPSSFQLSAPVASTQSICAKHHCSPCMKPLW
jgi:hypothetical protein